MKNVEEKIKATAANAAANSSSTTGGGKISGAQQEFNNMVRERLDDTEREVNRLQRIDFRLNKELVQKPYAYIDKIRDALDKEQKEIVNIVKNNNDKYITKITQMDHKVNKVLTDTETLLD